MNNRDKLQWIGRCGRKLILKAGIEHRNPQQQQEFLQQCLFLISFIQDIRNNFLSYELESKCLNVNSELCHRRKIQIPRSKTLDSVTDPEINFTDNQEYLVDIRYVMIH